MHGSAKRALCALLVLAAVPVANAATCFVTTTGTSANTGASWSSPYDLQTALGASACTEIWVAAGVYKPTASANRSISFSVDAGVAVYGGFAGTEATRSQRNPAANLTVLSGDLNGDDTDVNSGNGVDASVTIHNADNSYNVVSMNGSSTPITSATVLDGFTITGGNASYDGSHPQTQYGGGLFCNGENGNCSPSLSNLVFSGNAGQFGGAVATLASSGISSPAFTADTFSGNKATSYGGAVYLAGNSGNNSPSFTNVTFGGNSAPSGIGGGSGGAILSGASSPTLTNVTFSGNIAVNYGGALYQSGSGSATLKNVILVDNNDYYGTQFYVDGNAGITLDYSLMWNSASGSGACPGGLPGYLFCGGNMVYRDPKLGPLQNNGGYTPTFFPGPSSAAIDAGIDAPTCPVTDQRGVARPQGLHCDIGAVEVQRTLPCYVAATATGIGNGFDWADAFTGMQTALATNGCSEIWVAKGIYKPTTDSEQTISFTIPSGTAVYGGFAGNETQRSASNPQQNPTVLSGDLGGNDTGAANGIDATVPSDGTNSDNSTHVVYFDGRTTPVTASTVLDGFVITAGFANGGFPDDSGGGLICNANHAGTGVCSPTLSRLVFSGNYASSSTGGGGALYNDGYNGVASPALTDIVFSGNVSGGTGGAMRNDSYGNGSASSPTLRNVTFSGNTAGSTASATGDGGALFNSGQSGGVSSPMLTNVTFSGNVSGNSGGAITNNNNASPTLTNVTFSHNSALYYGGAIENNSSAHPSLSNAILWANTIINGAGGGPQIIDNTGTLTLDHSIVQGGCLSPTICTNPVVGDPKLGALANNGGFTPTFLPGTASAAIDAGTATGCPATDQRGIARPQGLRCDVGAVEVVAYDRIFADNFDGTPTP